MINNIQIYGPFNTGTNLVYKLLTDNISKNIKIFNNNWKHTLDSKSLIKCASNKNNLIILMYKNVYNWVGSILKFKYDFEIPNGYNNKCKMKDVNNKNQYYFDNIIDAYNQYYYMYIDLIENNSNVVWIDYYHLINKETSFQYLSNKLKSFDIKFHSEKLYIEVLGKPAKHHGKSVSSSDEAMNKYDQINKKYNTECNFLLPSYIDLRIIEYFEESSTSSNHTTVSK
jgi:hypothetical protein